MARGFRAATLDDVLYNIACAWPMRNRASRAAYIQNCVIPRLDQSDLRKLQRLNDSGSARIVGILASE
jgi:hypothetical protein